MKKHTAIFLIGVASIFACLVFAQFVAGPDANIQPTQIAGSDGTNIRKLAVDASGRPILVGFGSAATLSAAINTSPVVVEHGPRWQVVHTPAVSVQASASKAAGGAGVRHVADCISFSGGSTVAPVLTKLNVNLRDGATGAGTIIHSFTLVALAVAGNNFGAFSQCGLGLVGTANTAMTLEFSAALANLYEDVTLSGFDVQ